MESKVVLIVDDSEDNWFLFTNPPTKLIGSGRSKHAPQNDNYGQER